jgi:4-diphosphocytidyl-2-C-methyl-D-erythritol kinase
LRLEARAPAKLNLCLYVGRRRDDGLHELCSLFQAVTLADTVTMEPAAGDADEIVCPGVEGPNLAATALARFRERFGWNGPPVRVAIDKRIPVAGGLGGGSADAGAVLRLAVKASATPVHVDLLQEFAMTIGADVPSQVEPGSHLVLGAGEVLERLQKTWHLAAVLLTNDAGVSTADVYARHDEIGHAHRRLDHACKDLKEAVTTAGYDVLEIRPMLHNDLEQAALDLAPHARPALDLLAEAGAHVVSLSGSGPTAFGLFDGREEAEAARAALATRWQGGEVHAVHQAPSDYAVVRTS